METTDWKDEHSQLAPLLNSDEQVQVRRPPLRRRRSFLGHLLPFSQPRRVITAAAFLVLLGLLLLAYHSYPQNYIKEFVTKPALDLEAEFRKTSMIHPTPLSVNLVNYRDIQRDNFEFNMNASDVMVFLHIQKTGGTTFGKHLVQDIDLERPCRCRKMPKKNKKNKGHFSRQDPSRRFRIKCQCLRPGNSGELWLFSRYSTGWKCGLHPDWTELISCVNDKMDEIEGHSDDERRYFYVTFLRDPVSRFLSELKHVQRGATWKTATLMCNGRGPSPQELPRCYEGQDWKGVGIEEFMACDSNLAINRQTRMLANLELVNCYNTSGMDREYRDMIMLESAKENLLRMAFFGLTELQAESQYIFQETFNLRFNTRFSQYGRDHASKIHDRLNDHKIGDIEQLNHLDVKLYEFAKKVMMQRFEAIKKSDPDFEENFGHLSRGDSGLTNDIRGEHDEEEDYSY